MPLNLWSRLKTPDYEVQSFSRWCLPTVAHGTMVLTVVLSLKYFWEPQRCALRS